MRKWKILFIVLVILALPGCGVAFVSVEHSEKLNVQTDIAVQAARQANGAQLDTQQIAHALEVNATYFEELRKATGWFKPVYMNATFTQLLERMMLTSYEARVRYDEGELTDANAGKILSHQAVNLLFFQDARDGRADESADAYLARLYAKTQLPPTIEKE